MIERVCDDRVVRVDRLGFRGEWAYCGRAEDGRPQTLSWQYHANARNVDTGAERVMESAPAAQQTAAADYTRVGSEHEPNYLLTPSRYWPSTRWVLIAANLDKWLSHPSGARQSTAWWRFSEPLAPRVEVSRDSAVLTFAIRSRASEMGPTTAYDRSRTRWWLQVSRGGSFPEVPRYGTGGWSGEFAGDEHTVTWDATTLSPGEPVAVRVCAVNDGMCGASAVAASEEHVFAVPRRPTVSLSASGGSVLARVSPNADRWHPADRLVLQRQVAPRMDAGGSWRDVQSVSAGAATATAIMDGTEGRLPGEDEATWYRVCAWHDAESNAAFGYAPAAALMGRPKAPSVSGSISATGAVTATVSVGSAMDVRTYCRLTSGTEELTGWVEVAGGDNALGTFDPTRAYRIWCKSVTAAAPLDGHPRESEVAVSGDVRADAQAAFVGALLSPVEVLSATPNADGAGVTLLWSWGAEELGAADATEVGTLVEWTGASGGWDSTVSPSSHKVPDGAGTAGLVSVDGLEEGVAYRVRLRRYATVGGADGYGPEATLTATPWSTPGRPELAAPAAVAAGAPVEYSWTFSDEGDTPQTQARLHVGGEVVVVEGSACSYALETDAGMSGRAVEAWVEVCCGGGWSEGSDAASTLVAARPTCSLSPAGSLAESADWGGLALGALPLEVEVSGTGDRYDLTVTAVREADAPGPAGGAGVAPGQVVAWAEATAGGVVALPGDMVLAGGAYEVECVPRDTSTGLSGEAARLSFAVAWSSPATTPSGEVSVSGGVATVTPSQGEGARSDERCRLWRVTADGPELAVDGASWGVPHEDAHPPYGWDGCAYLVEAVTPDGDSRWASVPYELGGRGVTLEWDGGAAELSLDVSASSSYGGSFERRSHLDGSRAGFWSPGADRDWSASGVVEASDAALPALRALGRWDGPCLVRARGGTHLVAHVDVEVSDAGPGAAAVSLRAQAVDGLGGRWAPREVG